jgi:tetratricopeptide (TPR) repeat protein
VPRAFELFSRGQISALRADQEGNEAAVDLLSRAVEVDPSFVVAAYMLGVVHSALGNRWKAAAQFRAATQLDPLYPEPYKALGDLYLSQPRRLFDQAVEAYGKAIELRPFYADAYVGLGDAKAAKSDIDGAIAAYQKALVYNPVNPRVHMSLGKIYYGEKGLYYESVNAYKKAIDLDPSNPKFFLLKLKILLDQDKSSEGAKAAFAALALDKNTASDFLAMSDEFYLPEAKAVYTKIIEMGSGTNRRELFNLSQAKAYMQTLLVGSGAKRLIEQGKTTSLRGLYYMLKHTIDGTKEETFDEQSESDTIIEDVEVVLEALRRLCDEYGSTVVVVTHSSRLAMAADRVVEIRDGRVA